MLYSSGVCHPYTVIKQHIIIMSQKKRKYNKEIHHCQYQYFYFNILLRLICSFFFNLKLSGAKKGIILGKELEFLNCEKKSQKWKSFNFLQKVSEKKIKMPSQNYNISLRKKYSFPQNTHVFFNSLVQYKT